MKRRYFEAYDDRYRQVHKENLQWFADTPSPIVREVISTYDLKGRILELGCGEGRDAAYLLEHGFDILATDISEEAIRFCRIKWPEYASHFQILDCICGKVEEEFYFIYAIAVVHMLVRQEDRDAFYCFIREHLKKEGYALICSMGDGKLERCSDISTAFDLQERLHEESGKRLFLAGTSCRCVSSDTFALELQKNGLIIVEQGITNVDPDYGKMVYAVVKRADHF